MALNSTGEKTVPEYVKRALALKRDSPASVPPGKRKPKQNRRSHFHGYAALFLSSHGLGGVF